MDIRFHMMVYCQCGWALEEDKTAVPSLGSVTVKPCPICCKGFQHPYIEHHKVPEQEERKINRRGTMVSERST